MVIDTPPVDLTPPAADPAPVIRSADSTIKIASLENGPGVINVQPPVQKAVDAQPDTKAPVTQAHHHRRHHHRFLKRLRPYARLAAHMVRSGLDTVHAEVSTVTHAKDADRRWAYVERDKKLIKGDWKEILANDFESPLGHTAVVTSPYGPRINPITKKPEFHTGADFHEPAGQQYYASFNGGVVQKQQSSQAVAGNQVIVRYDVGGHKIDIILDHLVKANVKVGQVVNKGDVLGISGSKGRSTGPHAHVGVLVDGAHVDPIQYIHSLTTPSYRIAAAKKTGNQFAQNSSYNITSTHYKHHYSGPKLS
jgi:murein DD-endopeptidase MepM/ murein hydrolase activator NlpD